MPDNGPGRHPVALGEPAERQHRPAVHGLAREAVLIAFAMLLYFGIRNRTVGSADVALANADRLLSAERHLGIAWEGSVQSATVPHEWLVTAANWAYIWGHWPVILSAATLLYLYRRRHYYLLRNAFFVSGFIGFAFFALFPVAPPRLLDIGLVDTVTERSNAYRALQPPGLTNQYAAFPSLHAGWNLLLAIVVVMAVACLAVRLAAIALPVAMALAVVATANHYVIDVMAGVVVVLVGLAVAIFVQKRQDASTLGVDAFSGDRGGEGAPERAALRGGASGRKLPRQAA